MGIATAIYFQVKMNTRTRKNVKNK